jgi:single-stranded-DNA-specific exonuclease
VRNFNIHNALKKCSDLLEKFGGHKYAAGMELPPENLEAFRKRFEEVVSESISEDDLIPEIAVEAEIRFDEITASFFKILRQFAPFGPSNPNPVFLSRRVKDRGYARIVGDEHLKLTLTQGDRTMEAIAFRQHEKLPLVSKGKYIDICYSLEENEFQGLKSIQLNIKDIKPSE